jgi:cyclohexanecarboxylate-CoA ligase
MRTCQREGYATQSAAFTSSAKERQELEGGSRAHLHTNPGTGMKIAEKTIAGRTVRWDEARAQVAYSKGWWVRGTLADCLRASALRTPTRIVLSDGDMRLDCRTLYQAAVSLAHALLARLPIGSVVSFMLPNWHETAIIYHAATLAGMVIHPILPSLRDHELTFMLKDIESRLIFIPSMLRNHDYCAMLDRVVAKLPRPPEVVVLRGDPGSHVSYSSLFTRELKLSLPVLDPDAVRMVLYTSGTTGKPKGVLHSHNSIHALVRQIGQYWLARPNDTHLVASPVSHIGGSIYAFECPILLGTYAVLMDRWDADEAVRVAMVTRCTHMAGATPFLEQLLEAARRAHSELPFLKLFVCGGASVPPSLIREAASYFRHSVVTRVYGSTEVPVTTVGTLDRADLLHAAETDGRVGIADVKLEAQRGVLRDEGEILARGPQMLVGYLHPETESSAFDDEGYYRSGDLGRFADGNYLVVSGRAKDIIIRNGENISPKEVEDVLSEHPDIAEVAIVGLPDVRTGERAYAVVVPRESATIDIEGLRAFLSAKSIAKFKFPEDILVWNSLPKNDAGKILKHEIRGLLINRSDGKP